MTRSLKLLLCCIVACLCQFVLAETNAAAATAATPSSKKLTVYHQKEGNYIKRGEIVGLPGVPKYIPYEHEIVDFTSRKDAFYQIKIKDEQTGKVMLQSVKMCQMVASGWHDEFVLHLDENNDFYYSSYFAGSDNCPEKLEYPIKTKPFKTNVRVAQVVPGSKPLIGHYATQKPTQSSKKPSVDVNDEIPETKVIEEKSFFQKYWYLILGGAVLFLSAASAPEDQPPARR